MTKPKAESGEPRVTWQDGYTAIQATCKRCRKKVKLEMPVPVSLGKLRLTLIRHEKVCAGKVAKSS